MEQWRVEWKGRSIWRPLGSTFMRRAQDAQDAQDCEIVHLLSVRFYITLSISKRCVTHHMCLLHIAGLPLRETQQWPIKSHAFFNFHYSLFTHSPSSSRAALKGILSISPVSPSARPCFLSLFDVSVTSSQPRILRRHLLSPRNLLPPSISSVSPGVVPSPSPSLSAPSRHPSLFFLFLLSFLLPPLFLLITSPVTNRSEAEGTVVSPCDGRWSVAIGCAGPPSSAPEAVWREGCLFEAIRYLVMQLVAFISSVILPRDDRNCHYCGKESKTQYRMRGAAMECNRKTGHEGGEGMMRWEGWRKCKRGKEVRGCRSDEILIKKGSTVEVSSEEWGMNRYILHLPPDQIM